MIRKVRFFGFFTFDRYILIGFLKNFFISISFFVIVYFFSNLLTELPTLLKKADYNQQITVANVFKNFFFKIPGYFFTVFPFAFLFSTSFVLGNFFKNNEIVSIIASGWNMRRITFIIVFLSFFFSVFLMYLNSYVIPNYNYESAKLEEKLYQDVKVQDVDNIQTYGEQGVSYFARYYNAKSKVFISIIILQKRELGKIAVDSDPIFAKDIFKSAGTAALITRISEADAAPKLKYPYLWMVKAEQLAWDEKLEKWIVKDAFRWEWDAAGNVTKMEEIHDMPLDLKERPEFFVKETRNISEMSISESTVYIDKLKKSKQSYEKEMVEYYSDKYAKPFSVFILAILSSALGRFFSRKHLLVSTLVFSFVIGGLYYMMINVGISLGKEGLLPPFVAAFLGNFISIGVFFYIKRFQLT